MVQNIAIQMLALTIPSFTRVQGHLNLYNPQVKEGDSAARIYIIDGLNENLNIISTRWMVKLFSLGLQ